MRGWLGRLACRSASLLQVWFRAEKHRTLHEERTCHAARHHHRTTHPQSYRPSRSPLLYYLLIMQMHRSRSRISSVDTFPILVTHMILVGPRDTLSILEEAELKDCQPFCAIGMDHWHRTNTTTDRGSRLCPLQQATVRRTLTAVHCIPFIN